MWPFTRKGKKPNDTVVLEVLGCLGPQGPRPRGFKPYEMEEVGTRIER